MAENDGLVFHRERLLVFRLDYLQAFLPSPFLCHQIEGRSDNTKAGYVLCLKLREVLESEEGSELGVVPPGQNDTE